MFYRAVIAALFLCALAGCAQVSGRYIQVSERYLRGSSYDRAVLLYENGMLPEAREMAKSVGKDDANYKPSRKLLSDINALSVQLSRRHMEMGEDYERAGVFKKAVSEYETAFRYNPSNMLAREKAEVLTEALKHGGQPEPLKTASVKKASNGKEDPEDSANIHYLKGKIYLDAKAYAKAVEEFTIVLRLVPEYMNTSDLLARARQERDKAVDFHMKRGIAYFQSEDMERAVKEWDSVLDLDPVNRSAADYKYRAEVIMERLKKIRDKTASEQPL